MGAKAIEIDGVPVRDILRRLEPGQSMVLFAANEVERAALRGVVARMRQAGYKDFVVAGVHESGGLVVERLDGLLLQRGPGRPVPGRGALVPVEEQPSPPPLKEAVPVAPSGPYRMTLQFATAEEMYAALRRVAAA